MSARQITLNLARMGTASLVAFFLLVAYLSVPARAFLPRVNLASGDSTTLDHTLITKKGFLKPLIYFLRDNPQYLKGEYSTGFGNDILASDSPTAFQETVENISPQIQFLTALNEIQSANVEVDSFPLNSSAAAHFDGEQFNQGSKRLIQLRQELITSLLQGDKLQHARNLAGSALHTLQDFYSNSNWVELGNPGPYDVLGKPGSEIPQDSIAGPTDATCKSCPLDPVSGLTNGACENNLDTVKLTSGYRSGQDIEKPENLGKCSSGGKADASRWKPATGGINKDSVSIKESPHASLHNIAADIATEATSSFLGDIRSTVGDDTFAKFLNLKSENSLALVIDVSGSMSDEISEVKRVSIDFVRKTLQKKGASFTYILVPFSDPEVGPVTVTNDAQKTIEAVNKLTANGGGDCPELGMTGLYQALLNCLPETKLYYFSDADVKDEALKKEVISLAKEKKVKIDFILTGQCSRRKRRHTRRSAALRDSHRTKRSVQDLYQELASQTGGQVLETSKGGVAEVVKVINPVSSTDSSADLKEVELLNVKESRAQYFSSHSYFVDIDNTLERLVLTLTAASSPSLDFKMVLEGNAAMQKKVLASSSKLLILEVTSLVNGSLKLTVSCNGPYTLQVTGSSPLDFTYQLLDVEDQERGTTRRVVGNPLRGQTLLLTLDFVGREIDAVSNLTLVSTSGTDIETFSISQGQGFYQDSYFVTFIPTAERFRLKVTGLDKSGARFQRTKPTLFTLGDVKLSPNVDNRNNSNVIFPGRSLELEINVKNSGDRQTLYFTASDDLKFFNSISPTQGTLGENDTLVLRVSLLAPSDATYGVTSTVTVFASQNSDFSQVVNFMVFFVTVGSKDPDLSPPSCTVIKQTGTCAGVYGRPECVSSTWQARVMFIDAGEGLLSITTRENRDGTLTVGAFSQGAVNIPVPASFTSNCCNPRVLFVGLDLVGNMGTCSVSLVPDIVSLRAEPNNTFVSLNPGETAKVPFTLVNLGSKGSFLFHVTKTPQLYSYVAPFSLTLETNSSTAGHVIIKLRNETSEVWNLTVKAISQSNNVNVKEVNLFDIQVSTQPRQPTTPSLKHVRLHAVAPVNRVSITLGERIEVNFTVTNLASPENFTFYVISNQSSIKGEVQPSPVLLKTSQPIPCLLILTSQQDATSSNVTQINVTAKPASHNADAKELQVFSLTVTVFSPDPDLSPPTCTIINQTGTCAGVYGRPECVSSTWQVRVMFVDAGEGLLSVTTRENHNGTLKVGTFSQGAVNKSVPASFMSNCCNPRVLFVALDLVGNMGTCLVSLVPDIVSLRAEPNNTFVSLNPGETAKVPFTLVNLGSNGSFSFHVTKTPELFSYVTPFNLTLETNSSTAGHVIIKLRNETSEVWNLTVKAVSQSNNVNVKEVNLFDIQVSTQPRQPTTPSLKHVRLYAVAPVNRVSITPGERIEVNFTVTNLASAENFTFYVISNQSSVKGDVQPSSVFLKTAQTTPCLLILTSQQDATPSTVTQINVTAKPASHNADVKELQVFSLTVAVFSQDPDLSPPFCTIINQTGTCAGVYGRPECVLSTWQASVMFVDTGEGLLSVATQENRNGTLRVSVFSQGAVNKSVAASFTSNCCNPRVLFVALDLVGNMGTCLVSLVPDIMSLRAETNNTFVSLDPGETTKVPFKLMNLGSNGSFSFHVTKTPELISYVVPFSLTLQTNSSTAGHVIIKSRGETSEVWNLTVKAVSQSNTVNVKEVNLFDIQVSIFTRAVTQPRQPTTPSLKHVRLYVASPVNRLSIPLGERAEVNFTVTNLASAENFTFNVISNQSSIKGDVQPSSVFLKTSQTTSCLLILTSQQHATPNTVTQINVTATPASHHGDIKALKVFSLTVIVTHGARQKSEESQKENTLEIWHVVLITVSIAAIIVIVLVVCKMKHSSWSPKRPSDNCQVNPGYTSSQFSLHNFDEIIVQDIP